jgi:hypothetical protein
VTEGIEEGEEEGEEEEGGQQTPELTLTLSRHRCVLASHLWRLKWCTYQLAV